MRKEGKVEKHLRLGVEARGGICYKFESPGRSFVPDRLIALPFIPLHFIETKAPDGALSDGQKREHARLRKMGQRVAVLWTIERVDMYLKDCDYELA